MVLDVILLVGVVVVGVVILKVVKLLKVNINKSIDVLLKGFICSERKCLM